MPKEFEMLDAVAASGLMTAAVTAALVSGLIRKGTPSAERIQGRTAPQARQDLQDRPMRGEALRLAI